MTAIADTPMSNKDPKRTAEAVRRAEEALAELTALGLSVDVVLSNRIVSKPRHLPVEESDTLLEGEGALAYLNNPEVAECVLVLGSQHIRASSVYLSRWSSFFGACFEHDMAEKASSILQVEPPSVKYFTTTIEYLYTGLLPASALECSDVFFGLLANGHYLSCDRLVKECLTHLEAVLRGDGYQVFTSNAGFNSKLVPSDLVKRVASSLQKYNNVQYNFKAMDIMLDWLDKETETTKEGDSMASDCEAIFYQNHFDQAKYKRLFSNFRATAVYPRVLTRGLEGIIHRLSPK